MLRITRFLLIVGVTLYLLAIPIVGFAFYLKNDPTSKTWDLFFAYGLAFYAIGGNLTLIGGVCLIIVDRRKRRKSTLS